MNKHLKECLPVSGEESSKDAAIRREMNSDQKSRLENLAAQASALSVMLYGDSGEQFRQMHEYQQDNVLWLLSDLLHEMDTIVNRRRA